MERQLSAGSDTIGLLRKPDLSRMSPKEVVRLFLRLRGVMKNEKEDMEMFYLWICQ
jgi:hypothetical protein